MENAIAKQEVDIQALISQGLEKGAGIDVMERMFAMAKEMDAIRAKRAFFEALAKFESEILTIEKKKEVKDREGKHRYWYAPLEDIVCQVKAALEKNGFSYTLKVLQPEGKVTVICEAHHIAGHSENTDVTVTVGEGKFMSINQEVGAAITYAKRYSFCNAFGIMTGDEDTDAAEDENKETKPAAKTEEKKPAEGEKPLTADQQDIKNLQATITKTFTDKFSCSDVIEGEKQAIFLGLVEKAMGRKMSTYELKIIKTATDITNPNVLDKLWHEVEAYKL